MAATVAELAKSAHLPLGFAAFALAALLALATRHWSSTSHPGLLRVVFVLIGISLLGGLFLSYRVVSDKQANAQPQTINPPDATKASAKPTCSISGDHNTVIATDGSKALVGACGDVN